MFTKWRPVPSARTVRLLYQLGYICSGTAFGLATLCLEEQRRRIQILQRIADNAKIIRQHPRYKGNAALAMQYGDEFGSSVIGDGWIPERSATRHWRWREHRNVNGDAIQSPALPSVVEREYSEYFGRGDNGRDKTQDFPTASALDRRYHMEGRMPSEDDVSYESVPERTISAGNVESAEVIRIPENNEQDSTSYRTLGKVRRIGSTSMREPRGSRYEAVRTFGSVEQAIADEEHDPSDASEFSKHGDAPVQLEATHEGTDARMLNLSSQDLSHDIQLFLNSAVAIHRPSDTIISNKLLRSALAIGTLVETNSLVQWKLSTESFTQADARAICQSCSRLGGRFDADEVNRFFVEILQSNGFLQFGLRFRLELALEVLSGFLEINIDIAISPSAREMCEDFVRTMEDDIVAESLNHACRKLVSNGHSSTAARLLLLVAKSRKHQLLFVVLHDEILSTNISAGQLTDSAALLRWKLIHVNGCSALVPQMNSFIEACGKRREYGLLSGVFNRTEGLSVRIRVLERALTPENRATLAIAYSTDAKLQKPFERLYRTLPEQLRASVDQTSAPLSIEAIWKATRNLEEVESKIRYYSERLGTNADKGMLRRLDEATIEVYVRANKMDKALATITRMHKGIGASNVAICQTALLFAKQESWDSFARLLKILKKSESFEFDHGATRVFDAVIRVYCQHHNADEAWDFVATAIRDLRFTPTRASCEILLESFVAKGRFDLVPKWIDFLNDIGHNVGISAYMAVTLLRRYYIDHRPSHVFMMWLCRRLILHSPSFANEDLIQLVEQAIAYDLSHSSGQSASAKWQHEHAKARLERVRVSESFVPSPGFVWNDQIYFHDLEQNSEVEHMLTPPLDQKSISNDSDDAGDNIDDIHRPVSDGKTDFETLRPSDEHEISTDSQFEKAYDIDYRGKKMLEADMFRQLSTYHYQEVLDLYHEYLDAASIPASPVVLELAVEASLRLHRDRSQADEIISKAQEAGMNTTCATGPLLIYQLKTFDRDDKIDPANLRTAVLSYYRANDENGWPVKHHLGVNAAHFLMTHRQVNQGLDLLSSIYLSKWARNRPLDHVAMTVFLKGYIASQHLSGIEWVVRTVLDQDIRVTQRFMAQLKFVIKGNFKWMDKHSSDVHPRLVSWVELCAERRKKQIAETCKLGWSLVRNIAKSTKEGSKRSADAPVYLENDLFAGDDINSWQSQDPVFVDESYYSDEAVNESAESKRLEEVRKRMVEDWNAERDFRRRLKAAALAQGTRDRSPLRIPDVSGRQSSDQPDAEVGVERSAETVEAGKEDVASAFKPFF